LYPLQERESLSARVEGDEIDGDGTFTLLKNLACHVVRARARRVLPVSDDEEIFAKHAGAVQVGPCRRHGVADGRAAPWLRHARQRIAYRDPIEGLHRQHGRGVARKAVDANFDGEVRAFRHE